MYSVGFKKSTCIQEGSSLAKLALKQFSLSKRVAQSASDCSPSCVAVKADCHFSMKQLWQLLKQYDVFTQNWAILPALILSVYDFIVKLTLQMLI